MNGMTDIDILKSKNVKERDIEMFKLRVGGMSFKDIAAKFGLKNGVSVSRRVKKIRELLKGIDQGIKSGDIVLRNAGEQMVPRQTAGTKLMLPEQNPFLALDTFQDLAGISSAGGAVIGAGAATLIQGFQRDDLPYNERQMMVMKGGSVLASSILALYLTFNKFSQVPEKEMKIIDSKGEVIDKSGRSDGQH
jgi:hypothetical protein